MTKKRSYKRKKTEPQKIVKQSQKRNRKISKPEIKIISRPKKVVLKKDTVKIVKAQAKYKEVVYVGTADISTAKGAVTGKKYVFRKDTFGMPISVKVDEVDYPSMSALKGKGCFRREPTSLFIAKIDWDLEIAKAKRANS